MSLVWLDWALSLSKDNDKKLTTINSYLSAPNITLEEHLYLIKLKNESLSEMGRL